MRHRPPVVVDAHGHLGPFRNFHIPENDSDGVVAAMDSMGIDTVVLSAHAGISSDYRLGNDLVMEASARHPGRILGYCAINPNYADDLETELLRCFDDPAFRGIKLHPELHGGHRLDASAYRPVWEFANHRRLPVLSHSFYGGDGLDVFARIATDYPGVAVILGHAGQDFGLDAVADLVLSHDNVWLDLSGALTFDGVVERFVERLGHERILLGTDLPFIAGALQLGTLLHSRLSPEAIDAIAGGNAVKLFGIAA